MRPIIFNALLVMAASISLPVQADQQDAWPADCKLVPVAQLPMTLETGHVVIPALANGKDVTLGIDTGGFGTSLTKAGIARLGLLYAARLGAIIPAGGGAWVSEGDVHLDSLRIGDLELDRMYLPQMDALPGVDGLIGPDILNKYDVELDFGGETFRLFKIHPCADHVVTWTSSYAVLPFTLTESGHVRVAVTLDGQNVDAILDTGAPISVLSTQDANSLFRRNLNSAEVEAANPVSGPAWGKGRLVRTYATTFKTLTIGGVTIPGPRIDLVEGRNFLGHDFASLVLGNDVLSRFHLTIAYRQQKLYITDAQAH
ncbi:MAG TPA: aspartyl protease family protein [Rhizomicrobium sp.]|jgi:predicted aspartyl protease|nr:aspartyl protease family protein [Rhizomicrobium sp.]